MRALATVVFFSLLWGCAMDIYASEPLEIGSRTQLFLDDYITDELEGLKKTLHQPLKRDEPVLRSETPWDMRKLAQPCPVVTDEGLRLYYLTDHDYWIFGGDPPEDFAGGVRSICVAESSDGIVWRRPSLDTYTTDEFPATNIVLAWWEGPRLCKLNGVGVMEDPDPPDPSERFKMFYNRGNTGTFSPKTSIEGPSVAFSPDGLRWTPCERNPVFNRFLSDTQQNLIYDQRSGTWVAFVRVWESPQDGRSGWRHYGGRIRCAGRMESKDFRHWTEPETVIRRDGADPEFTDFYSLQATMHNGILIGLLWTDHWVEQWTENEHPGKHGKIDIQLVVSRDLGKTWTRVDRQNMFLKTGPKSSYDAGSVLAGPMITIGDTHYIYYGGHPFGHGYSNDEYPAGTKEIYLATLPRDRFVSVDAGEVAGQLATKPFVVPGGSLQLNVVTAPEGQVVVTVLGAGEQPIPGFEASHPVEGDLLRAEVTWPDANLSELVGRTVRLRLTIKNASLFSFGFNN